ncbi:MAG: glycosyltransferase family 4 protein [Cyanobacteria bacterium P01_F01_bin.143]
MKILLVSGVYPPQIGGPSAQTEQIAQGLIARGIEVKVVTYGNQRTSKIINGIPVTFLDGSPRRGLIDKIVLNWQVFTDLLRIIKDFRPTVLHMQTASSNLAIMTGVAAKLSRVPAMIKFSSDLVWDRANRDKLMGDSSSQVLNPLQKLSNLMLELTQGFLFFIYDRIWATTPIYKERLRKKFQVRDRKIFLLPNIIDLQAFEKVAATRQTQPRSLNKNIVLLTISRLVPWKGIELCLEALSHLEDLPVSLRIVGNGAPDYELSLRELADRLGVRERVEFIGAVPPNKVAEEYRTADIFMLASYYEPFGIVLVEAMAAGVPIVATNVGGIPTVVEDGVSAQLVPSGDSLSLAKEIRALVKSDTKLQDMAIAARTRSKQFDIKIVLDKLVGTYQSLALGDRRRLKN